MALMIASARSFLVAAEVVAGGTGSPRGLKSEESMKAPHALPGHGDAGAGVLNKVMSKLPVRVSVFTRAARELGAELDRRSSWRTARRFPGKQFPSDHAVGAHDVPGPRRMPSGMTRMPSAPVALAPDGVQELVRGVHVHGVAGGTRAWIRPPGPSRRPLHTMRAGTNLVGVAAHGDVAIFLYRWDMAKARGARDGPRPLRVMLMDEAGDQGRDVVGSLGEVRSCRASPSGLSIGSRPWA
jgi:hypothetical protein